MIGRGREREVSRGRAERARSWHVSTSLLRILLEELVKKYPPFHLAGQPTHSRMEGGHHMGVTYLPVKFVGEAPANTKEERASRWAG